MPGMAVIFGCAGHELSFEEISFFKEADPWGFILFRRNVDTPDQLRRLTTRLREVVGRDAPILVDQEGGRVQRLSAPHWPKYPPARRYGDLKLNDPFAARELVRLTSRLMAHDLLDVGINVDCLPVLDVPVAGAHDVIGDRAYAADVSTVATFGRAAAEGLLAGGVLPVMKHIPGHGRAAVDSHLDLPVVAASQHELEAADFLPFRMMTDMPAAMTAHVVYSAFDPSGPGSTSRKIIRSVIRRKIGFDGLLMSDDLSMKALGGTLSHRTEGVFKAGCDLALHCNGRMDEMLAVAQAAVPLAGKARRRADAALARIRHIPEPLDVAALRERLQGFLPD